MNSENAAPSATGKLPPRLGLFDSQHHILVGQDAGKEIANHLLPPILASQQLLTLGVFVPATDASRGIDPVSGYFAAEVAGCDSHFGVVADPLHLARVGLGIHIEDRPAGWLCKPHRSSYAHSAFAECLEVHVLGLCELTNCVRHNAKPPLAKAGTPGRCPRFASFFWTLTWAGR